MLETHLNSAITRGRLRKGPAADHIDAFADWLHLQGYRPVSIKNLLTSLASWTDWMLAAGYTAQDLLLGLEACRLAVEKEPSARYSRGPNRQSLTAASTFIRFLQRQGELPARMNAPSARDRWPILGEFRSWMRTHRGLTETTLDVYEGILVGLLGTLRDDGSAYSAGTLRAFVLERGARSRDPSCQEHCCGGSLLRPLSRCNRAMPCRHGTRDSRFRLIATLPTPSVPRRGRCRAGDQLL